ncbi:hypothetical protein ACFVYP_22520 [Kitasatospora sp. NPDC058201]|uniref:hypothetical protein n=1 Tax=unclassified Kitasatospora TaxID=2633591 RepID=UPI0036583E83
MFTVLDSWGLPTDSIIVSARQRETLLRNTPDVILEGMSDEARSKAPYLAKMIMAGSVGLFDAALNYLWIETINRLRDHVAAFDVGYFFDLAELDPARRKNLSRSASGRGGRGAWVSWFCPVAPFCRRDGDDPSMCGAVGAWHRRGGRTSPTPAPARCPEARNRAYRAARPRCCPCVHGHARKTQKPAGALRDPSCLVGGDPPTTGGGSWREHTGIGLGSPVVSNSRFRDTVNRSLSDPCRTLRPNTRQTEG